MELTVPLPMYSAIRRHVMAIMRMNGHAAWQQWQESYGCKMRVDVNTENNHIDSTLVFREEADMLRFYFDIREMNL